MKALKKKRVAMVTGRFLVRCFLIMSFLSSVSLRAVVYGSESSVSIVQSVTFPAVDNDNAMLCFGFFKNGFSLEDSSTVCAFKSIYPVSGVLALNGGQLHLYEDFIVSNTASLVGGGSFIADNHMIQLCSAVKSLTSTYTFKDAVLALGADMTVTGQLVFEGDCYLSGKLFHMDLSGGSIIVASGSRLVFDDIYLDNLAGSNIACADDTASIVLHDTQWHQAGDFTFDTGSIEFSHAVEFIGSHTFWYDSSLTSTVASGASWTIMNEMMLKVGRKNAVDYVEPLYFVDETSTIKLDNCSLMVTSSGIGLSKGKFEFDRDVAVDVLSSSTLNGLIIGTGQEGGDFSMKLNSGAAISLLAGWWVYNNMNSSGRLQALSPSSRCTRYADSKFCVQKNWIIPPMIFQVASGEPISLLESGATIRYNKTKLVTPQGELDITGGDQGSGFLLSGNDSLYMNNGQELLPIYVSGPGNSLHGTGDIAAPIILQDSATELSCQLNGVVNSNMVLNGGRLILNGDLDLGLDVILSGSGVVDLSTKSFNFGIKSGYWDSSIAWDGDLGIIKLNSDVNLVGTWTFNDNCIVDGASRVLDLTGGGQIVVSAGSHLVLQDIVIKGIIGDSIKCLDDNASIELNDVIWEQNESFTFGTGSLLFSGQNVLQGAYDFVYDSLQTATIDSNSRLAFTDDMTLVIGRKQGTDYVEPLYMVNSTSALQLNNCSYVVTSSGMRLTNGKVEVCGDVSFEALSVDPAYGLELGDGVEGHDVVYRFDSDGSLKFKSGWLIYNCFSPHGFIASSENASVIRSSDAGLVLKRSWTFPRMGLRVESGAPATLSEGGSIVTYDNSHITFSDVEFDILGQLVGSVQFRLGGNQSLYPTKGVFPCYLYIDGTGNGLYGTGDLTGPIIFQSSAAELSCGINGTIFFSPVLNGGKIKLNNDLKFGPNVTLTTGGQIDLSYYRLILSSSPCSWTKDTSWSGMGGVINLRADIDLSSTWSITNNCIIDGNSCDITLLSGGNLVVQDNSSLTIKNATIKGVAGDNIRCLTQSGRLILDNVSFEYSDHAHFSAGSIKTLNAVDFIGSYSFVYDSSCTSTIGAGSQWSMGDGLLFETGINNGNNPVVFESKYTSVLSLENSSLLVTSSGLLLTAGHVVVDGDVSVDAPITSSAVGFILGDGTAAGDMSLTLNSGASMKFKSGWFVYNNTEPDKFMVSSKNSRMIRYADSKAYIQQDWTLPEMTLVVQSGQPVNLIESGKVLSYDNVRIVFENAEFDFAGILFGNSYFALNGDGLLFLTKGSFAPYLSVRGAGNRLRGTGDIVGPVIFANSDAELISDLNGSIMYNVVLNGGNIILANDFYLGPQNTLVSTGTIDLGGHRCVFGTEDQLWTSTLVWKDGSLSLNSHIVLHGSWTVEESCVVNGNGNMLDLDGSGSLIIADGATLTLRNIRVRGISEEQIRCLGQASTLILDDVIWEQDGDATFSQGKIQWAHDVKMKGNFTFSYQSGQVSTILMESNLKLDPGFTFKYDPLLVASQDLIAFEDASASLVLNSATLLASVTGLRLQHGVLRIKGDSFFKSEQVLEDTEIVIDEGICLGSGDVADDMRCELGAGASLNVVQGSFIYNNYSASSFVVPSGSSRLSIYAGARLSVQETLSLGVGALYLSNQARVDIKPGKELLGSVFTTE